jgi:ligand-binding SRPBCC domain-containing protein
VNDKVSFVDEQRKGPYKLWRHEHRFEQNDNGILMTDVVDYSLPLSFLGRLAHPIFVKKKLNDIFEFRYQQVEQLFNRK